MKFKDFTINYLGEPWAKVRSQASWEQFKERADDYDLGGELPDGVLRLYAGADIQKDRIEVAVVGVGEGLEKWLVDYKIFYGDTSRLADPVWGAFSDYCYSTSWVLFGAKIYISSVAVDTGYDPRKAREKDWASKSHIVYDFIASRQDIFLPVRGTGDTKQMDLIKQTRTTHSRVMKRFDLNTPVFKEMIFTTLMENGGPGAIHFPKWQTMQGARIPTSDELFKQFVSERFQEVRAGVMGWKKITERNEVLDTVIYAESCAYIDGLNHWDSVVWAQYRDELMAVANE